MFLVLDTDYMTTENSIYGLISYMWHESMSKNL